MLLAMQSFGRRIFSTLGRNSNNINNNSTNNILVINCGSSSVKFQIIDPLIPEIQKISGIAERLSTPKAFIKLKIVQDSSTKKQTIPIENSNHKVACDHIYELIKDYDIKAIGHRVVHGGKNFKKSVHVTNDVKREIKQLFPLAPLHNPKNLMGIELMEEKFPTLKQIAVFDTSFHVNSVPEKTYRYAIPENWYENYNVRRYGFHGTSHKYVACQAAKLLEKPIEDLKIITAHLGHGCRYYISIYFDQRFQFQFSL